MPRRQTRALMEKVYTLDPGFDEDQGREEASMDAHHLKCQPQGPMAKEQRLTCRLWCHACRLAPLLLQPPRVPHHRLQQMGSTKTLLCRCPIALPGQAPREPAEPSEIASCFYPCCTAGAVIFPFSHLADLLLEKLP